MLTLVLLGPAMVRAFGLTGGAISFLVVQLCFLLAAWSLSTRIQPMPWHRPWLALRELSRAWKKER